MDIDPQIVRNLLFQAVRALQFYANEATYKTPSYGSIAEAAALPAPIDGDIGQLAREALRGIDQSYLDSQKPIAQRVEVQQFHYEDRQGRRVRVDDIVSVNGHLFYSEAMVREPMGTSNGTDGETVEVQHEPT